ncbi:hypothetical protein C7I85_18960 [Mesorhizobium soli]|uniref:Uncharacterized protein n=1 Tax=Pseudaminobacter soli (ex Li et al. 2025) TaxID=1295366 RepID=A0A2P7S7R4_9HYPH|nr:hypothetical protein C7I85_18960 [Mesorhizobium soli]
MLPQCGLPCRPVRRFGRVACTILAELAFFKALPDQTVAPALWVEVAALLMPPGACRQIGIGLTERW